MEAMEKFKVPLDKLKRICNYEQELDFCQTSLDVPPPEGMIGQERAVRAMEFGLSMNMQGYNIFVVGPPGTGKSTYVRTMVSQIAKKGTTPDDWCYINNFNDPDSPMVVSLPPGHGRGFQKNMEELVIDLRAAIPKAFEGSDYEDQKISIIQGMQDKVKGSFLDLEQQALKEGFVLKQSPMRFVFIPLKNEKPLSSEEYEELTIEERNQIENKLRVLKKKLDEIMLSSQMLEKEAWEQISELEKQITLHASEPLFARLKSEYTDFQEICEYLDSALKDIVDNRDIFRGNGTQQAKNPFLPSRAEGDAFNRYKVNLFVNNEKCEGAPVFIEPSPTYYNLFGKIEYISQMMGGLITDFTMIKPGAIHRANGGYLILQAKDILMEPFAWSNLKKALQFRQAILENIGEQYRFVPTTSLRPEPIPLDVKVILIGSPLFYLYYSWDEDFKKLFKVKVDFDTEMPRSKDNLKQYVSFVSSICSQNNLKHFNRSGLARIIEFSSRLAGDQNKLTTQLNEVCETVFEAIELAQHEGAEYVDGSHVNKAIEERKYRTNRLEEKIQENILENKILIDTEGRVTGQVNGLSIIQLSGYMFGLPSRITARTYMGHGGIINIERETEMSGSIHSKGVLTLSGYLGGKFGQNMPLGLTAQITFEQNYEGVDGDSASSAELYAILSSLADIPLKQNLSVTGSVNQHGQIQPVGGITQKVEGFFDICKAKGLTGDQGVVIPSSNIDNLMLKDEVLDAVKDQKFHIFAVSTIDEGIELLSGFPAEEVFTKASDKLSEFNKGLATAKDQLSEEAMDNTPHC